MLQQQFTALPYFYDTRWRHQEINGWVNHNVLNRFCFMTDRLQKSNVIQCPSNKELIDGRTVICHLLTPGNPSCCKMNGQIEREVNMRKTVTICINLSQIALFHHKLYYFITKCIIYHKSHYFITKSGLHMGLHTNVNI